MTPRKSIDIAAAANKLLGFKSLRPGQREAIQSLLEGRDTLLVQPTGSGKSAVYQIAGALLQGPTVIVSPLIALQKDQADSIQASSLEPTVVLNSTLTAEEHRRTLEEIENGSVEYIFLAPEQLRKPDTVERLKAANVSLFAVDEAHCISQWGHDFRPDYLALNHIIEALDHPPVLAMTATASKEVREEIIARLGMNTPRVFVHGFDRPNISLRVDLFSSKDEKYQALLRRVEFADKPGIVYVATHKNAETIAADLQAINVPAVFYHGGLKAREREEIQNRFMNGDVPVIVATNAFGMGVDKPDIRFVYHADVSDSVDAYYQEIGRAGRDGEPAEAVLFYRPQDISSQSFKTGTAHVDAEALEAVYNALVDQKGPITREELCQASKFSARKLVGLIHKLEETGAMATLEDGMLQATSTRPLSEVIEGAEQHQKLQKELRKTRLQQMQQYAEWRSCRRERLLRYFGDELAGPCGNCDRCEERGVLAKVA
ncbi:ATP-dependent DNA helicase RecQ [Acidobacteria bacterium AB60]|nr:ATP-dependent DNA helicase RecQ [Acidobacteria bacterium AB60]